MGKVYLYQIYDSLQYISDNSTSELYIFFCYCFLIFGGKKKVSWGQIQKQNSTNW